LPYKSKAQLRFLHARHPGIAKRWDKEHGVPKNLPEHSHRREALKRRARG
jgi:hypothetical protein